MTINGVKIYIYVFIILRLGRTRRTHTWEGGKRGVQVQGEQGAQAREGHRREQGEREGHEGRGHREGEREGRKGCGHREGEREGARDIGAGRGKGRGVRDMGAGRGKGRGARGVGAGRGKGVPMGGSGDMGVGRCIIVQGRRISREIFLFSFF
jgi:hypothetical protein